jgi:cytochrome b561
MPSHYTRTAVALHWTVAALIIIAFAMGWIMTDMAVSPLKLRVYSWHKWVGITVLALFFVRGLWRLSHAPPALLPMPAWQRLIARFLHGFLYAMMLVQPITGWIYSNASGYPIVYLSLIPLPNLVGRDKALATTFEEIHSVCGVLLAIAIGLHLLAALQHHFIDRDDTLRRMLRWQPR